MLTQFTIEPVRLSGIFSAAFANERVARGWSGEVARVVAWALLPFPGSPIPSRDLEEVIRNRCSQLAEELNRSQNSEFESLCFAERAAEDYVKIAKRFGDGHFVEEWHELLIEAIECGKWFPWRASQSDYLVMAHLAPFRRN